MYVSIKTGVTATPTVTVFKGILQGKRATLLAPIDDGSPLIQGKDGTITVRMVQG